MFGWKEIKPTIITIILALVVLIIIATGILFSREPEKEAGLDLAQPVIDNVGQAEMIVEEENETGDTFQPELPEDKDIYEVNTFFFSPDCVFKYDKGMDDVNDLKSYIAKTEGRIEVAINENDEESLSRLNDELDESKEMLRNKVEEMRSLINECRSSQPQ